MTERIPLSKTVRFEVFKRDSFTCQYCGGKAPDVVLHVDHIKPVADGGGNDLMNLVTSCEPCNLGKGARRLNDMSVVERQRRQIEDLQERREQLEMMMEWRSGLSDIKAHAVDAVCEYIASKSQFVPNEAGRRDVSLWLSKHSLEEILEAVDTSFDQYIEFDATGAATFQSWGKAFGSVPGIMRVRQSTREKPYLRDLLYIRGILRNRLVTIDERNCIEFMEDAHTAGMPIERLKVLAKKCRSWAQFFDWVVEEAFPKG